MACGKQRSSCINFEVDLRTDSALKIFVYTSQYKQRNLILFSRKAVYRFATRCKVQLDGVQSAFSEGRHEIGHAGTLLYKGNIM